MGHETMPNPAFERDSPRSGRAPQFYVRPMKNAAITIALALLAIVVGYRSFWAYSFARDQNGQEMVLSVMATVEEIKKKSGSYPTKFDAPRSWVWGILPGPEVTYHFDGANCIVYYQEKWPLGPLSVLDCKTKEWYYQD